MLVRSFGTNKMLTTKFWALAVLLSVVTVECHIVSRKYDSSASSLDTSEMKGEIEGTDLDFQGESSAFYDQDDEEDDEDSSCDGIAPERRYDDSISQKYKSISQNLSSIYY